MRLSEASIETESSDKALPRSQYQKQIKLLDALSAYLSLFEKQANRQTNSQFDQFDTKRSFVDEFIDIHCTPWGIAMPSYLPSHGLIEDWKRVGSYLKHAMTAETKGEDDLISEIG